MTLNEIREQAITPALALLPARMSEKRAQVDQLMLTAHLQEAPNREQCQLPIRPGKCGPARGIWQFERAAVWPACCVTRPAAMLLSPPAARWASSRPLTACSPRCPARWT